MDDRDKPGHDGTHAAMQVFGWSASAKLGGALVVESFDAFPEIVGLAQAAVVETFKLDGDGERRILGVVEQLLRRALRQRMRLRSIRN